MRRGHVDETKPAANEDPEADAVAKGGDNRGPRKGRGNVEDLEIGTKEPDEALDREPPKPGDDGGARGAAAAKGDDVDRGGGAESEGKESPTETGAKARKKRKLGFFF